MKQFIVLLAVLPLTLAMIMQIGLAQSNSALMTRAEGIVGDYRASVRETGGFTSDMRSELAMRLAELCDVDAHELSFDLDENTGADGKVCYRIGVPIKKIVAANRLFGISDTDNDGLCMIEGEILADTSADGPEDEAEPEDEAAPAP